MQRTVSEMSKGVNCSRAGRNADRAAMHGAGHAYLSEVAIGSAHDDVHGA